MVGTDGFCDRTTRPAAAAVEEKDAKASDIEGDERNMGCEAGPA